MNECTTSFDEVYATYHARIRRYLGRLLGPDEAQDVSQEVFAKVHSALQKFRGESQLSTWIYRIAHNAAQDRLRAAARQRIPQFLPVMSGEEGPRLGATGIDEGLTRDEMRLCIRGYVDDLLDPYRTVLILKDLEDLSNREIAEILGASLATVKIRLHRARAKLKELLATNCQLYRDERNELTTSGFSSDLPIWITEMGSYSGDPPASPFPASTDWPPQTERQQASDYFKRFIYSLSRGVQKVFPAFGLIEGFIAGKRNYFDHTGLIYNGVGTQDPDYPDADPDDLGLGVKKLGYYTYKKMTETLEGADWSTVTLLRDGTGVDQLYLVRVMKGGQPIFAAWWDYFDEQGYTPGDTKDISLTGLTGQEVSVTTVVPNAATGQDVVDYATAFDVVIYPIAGGSATASLGEDPVIIEPSGALAIPTVSEWGMIVMALLLAVAALANLSSGRWPRTP